MIEKILGLIRKYSIAILSCLAIIIIGLIITLGLISFKDSEKIKTYKNDNYALEYDSSWKIKEKNNDSIKFVHNKDSELNIKIVSLEEKYQYSTTDELVDELLYDLGKQNNSYKLLTKEKSLITKYEYDGYKLLYENDESQVLVMMGKKADKVLLATYESTSKYFDILLDSVQNIIYNFQILDETYNLTYKLNLDTGNIDWSTNDEIKDTSNVNEYEIANNNYYVKYSIPTNFQLKDFDSTSGYFDYKNLSDGSISLTTTIRNVNIYEYLEKDYDSFTIYFNYNYQREGKEGYSNFNETLQKLDNKKYNAYIYKNSYKLSEDWGTYEYEEVILVYELDSNHLIEFKIRANNNKIPKELVDNINVKSSKNYASYITKEVVDNNLIAELKQFTDYEKTNVKVVTLKVPEKYEELDKENNMYKDRYYGLNYNSENELYQYDIKYQTRYSFDITLSGLKSSYEYYKKNGTYQELTYNRDIVLNDKTFKVYTGGYTNYTDPLITGDKQSYYVNVTALFYELDEDNCLVVEIKGNNAENTDEILKQLTNFDVEIKKYEGNDK